MSFHPIVAQPEKVVAYTQAIFAHHNYLRITEAAVYCPPPGKAPIAVHICTCTTYFACFLGFIDAEDGAGNTVHGRWRADEDPCQSLQSMRRVGSNRCAHVHSVDIVSWLTMP